MLLWVHHMTPTLAHLAVDRMFTHALSEIDTHARIKKLSLSKCGRSARCFKLALRFDVCVH